MTTRLLRYALQAADLRQPLHTTIHFDGRAQEDGSSPRTGIHQKVDGLLHKLGVEVEEVTKGLKATAFEDLSDAVFAEFHRSHGLVERVYELEDRLPSVPPPPRGTDAAPLGIKLPIICPLLPLIMGLALSEAYRPLDRHRIASPVMAYLDAWKATGPELSEDRFLRNR